MNEKVNWLVSLISIVDDDQSVREATTSLLKSNGFRAEVFSSAEDFLASRYLDETKCLILDVQMPGMNGLELVRAMQARTPALRSFLLTGHVGDLDAALGQRDLKGRFTLLRKPIRPSQLARVLAEAFD